MINFLPDELIRKILLYLDIKSLENINKISKLFRLLGFYKFLIPYYMLNNTYCESIMYENTNLTHYLTNEFYPAHCIKDNISIYLHDLLFGLDYENRSKIKNSNRNMFCIKSYTIHPYLKDIVNKPYVFKKNTDSDRYKHIRKMHIIFRIPRVIYLKLRRESLTVLALIY